MKKFKVSKNIFIVISVLFFLIISIGLLSKASEPDALDFIGNIIGSLIGVLGAYLVLKVQINTDALRYKNEKDESTYFKILDLFKEVKRDLKGHGKIFEKVLEEIKEAETKTIKDAILNDKQLQFSLANKDFIKLIYELFSEYEYSAPGEGHLWQIKIGLEELISSVEENNYLEFVKSVNEIEGWREYPHLTFSDEGWQLLQPAFDLYAKIEENEMSSYDLNEQEKRKIIDDVFSKHHNILGNYFRVLYKLIKQIMNSSFDMKQKEEYLGLTRAILSSEELLTIFYNSFYSIRGEGLKQVLTEIGRSGEKTGFFADELDLENFNIKEGGQVDLPFFKYDDLIFGDEDLEKIQSLTNYKN
ncbi:putative phage abortive infection protein [Lactococcus petauri]|uniref:putative phage abortive infection protein n=1 Tax=Lactococcus petauri TaxID=1940789 RepID=UPI00385477F9